MKYFKTVTPLTPPVVAAVRWTGKNFEEVVELFQPLNISYKKLADDRLHLEGRHNYVTLTRGEWLVKEGEVFRRVEHEIFTKYFEETTEPRKGVER